MTTGATVDQRPRSDSVRALQDGEESAFLELVAHWPFRDERKGEEFFARPMQLDERFEMSDIFGAFVQDELVSCCQLFPRSMRIAGESISVAGIGTVFTREDQRGQGLAPQVITAALNDAATRGFELAMLHANRFTWYAQMGFAKWGPSKAELRVHGQEKPQLLGPNLEIAQFDAARHLGQVRELAASYSADRHGTLIRDDLAWRASLAMAGNPVEEFVVLEEPTLGDVVAFLRSCVIGTSWQVLEWACAVGHESHLAELLATTLRTVAQPRVMTPRVADPALERALLERGLKEQGLPEDAPEWMLTVLDGEALSERFGLSDKTAGCSSDQEQLDRSASVLNIVMPPAAFHFWTADRF